MTSTTLFWRRLDVEGLERLELSVGPDEITASSTVLYAAQGGLRVDHRWRLTPQWRALSVTVERWGPRGHGVLNLERDGEAWRVDGGARPDLAGAAEPDLSVTPFCNTFPIRRTPPAPGGDLRLDTAYIDAAALTVVRSSQRYERLGPDQVRYIDLGVAKGFEADLRVDDRGLVLTYEHLFERVAG